MKISNTIFAFTIFVNIGFSQSQDYKVYHNNINKAEELFFAEQKSDSSLYYYDQVFSTFDFIFLKDIVNAAQIAQFTNRDYKKYLELGFRFGLKPDHLKHYPLFVKDYSNLLTNKNLMKAFQTNRRVYLQTIDFKYLNWIYKIGLQDQIDKNGKNYDQKIYSTVMKLRDSIVKKGFPGERLLGVTDSTIFKDGGRMELDLIKRINRRKELSHIVSDDEILSQKWAYIILIHNFCSYSLLKEILLKELTKGNIHPRDIATIYDNTFRSSPGFKPSYCGKAQLNGAYRLNVFVPEFIYNKINSNKIDRMRKELFIVSQEVDRIKKEYEEKHGFILFTGFFNNR